MAGGRGIPGALRAGALGVVAGVGGSIAFLVVWTILGVLIALFLLFALPVGAVYAHRVRRTFRSTVASWRIQERIASLPFGAGDGDAGEK
ncbi:MAG: hypothetical protein IT457_07720 [Planctomycetes bacterium]|nr:hypothetical protein [Planctomycetota bacterium]